MKIKTLYKLFRFEIFVSMIRKIRENPKIWMKPECGDTCCTFTISDTEGVFSLGIKIWNKIWTNEKSETVEKVKIKYLYPPVDGKL